MVIYRVKKAALEISKLIPLDCVYLYGSYAHGRPKPYSDVDVAVVSPAFGGDIIKDTVFLMEHFEKTGLMVEPRAYTREELRQAQAGTFLYDEVLKKGFRIL
ncbi:MAG TPA: nucleotidyltransferase domain-containing protein [Firmicutes bacterium]|nr:nucleotidyltransferase domain-containing protein [Bacillota bacterium]HHY98662.1 nucleotidyltransferase domain-containing protein [Bacillota bacterium]